MANLADLTKSLFVIIPSANLWNAGTPSSSQAFLRSASRVLNSNAKARTSLATQRNGPGVTFVDEVAPRDTVLVEMEESERIKLQQQEPGLRLIRVEVLEPLWLQRFRLVTTLGLSAGAKVVLEVEVVDAKTGKALANIDVVGLSDRAQRMGASNKTDETGVAKLMFPAGVGPVESVEAFAPMGYWPAYATQVDLLAGRITLQCQPIDLSADQVLRHFDLEGAETDGEGVRVGVVDTGVSRHRDLRIAKGQNMVKGERATAYSDLLGHGTHVAGVIAGRGGINRGMRGVAPGIDLNAYRVFGKGQQTALSFNIAKGIRQAVDDGCDLINLSLGGENDVPDVLREIHRAQALGVVCVAATGNDYRSAVNYPARYSAVLGVSAFGRIGTWPELAAQDLEVVKPFGQAKENFIAAFSNIGSEVKLTAPGVGIVSTYPGGYAVMDGTSMASPATTGALARALAKNKKVLSMSRNQKRSDAITKLALNAATSLGFQARFEGAGVLL